MSTLASEVLRGHLFTEKPHAAAKGGWCTWGRWWCAPPAPRFVL